MSKGERGDAPAEEERSVKYRRSHDQGERAHSRHAFFKTRNPAAESHLDTDVKKEEQEQRNGLWQAKMGKPFGRRMSAAGLLAGSGASTQGTMKKHEDKGEGRENHRKTAQTEGWDERPNDEGTEDCADTPGKIEKSDRSGGALGRKLSGT